MAIRESAKYVIIGAGVHGLSTAYHLARELDARGEGSGADVVDARQEQRRGGRVRHRLRRRAQQLLPARDGRADGGVHGRLGVGPDGLPLHPVGYIALGSKVAGDGPDRGRRAPRAHRLPVAADRGRGEVREHMRKLFPDWRARGVSVCLHEGRGGFAFNQ